MKQFEVELTRYYLYGDGDVNQWLNNKRISFPTQEDAREAADAYREEYNAEYPDRDKAVITIQEQQDYFYDANALWKAITDTNQTSYANDGFKVKASD